MKHFFLSLLAMKNHLMIFFALIIKKFLWINSRYLYTLYIGIILFKLKWIQFSVYREMISWSLLVMAVLRIAYWKLRRMKTKFLNLMIIRYLDFQVKELIEIHLENWFTKIIALLDIKLDHTWILKKQHTLFGITAINLLDPCMLKHWDQEMAHINAMVYWVV